MVNRIVLQGLFPIFPEYLEFGIAGTFWKFGRISIAYAYSAGELKKSICNLRNHRWVAWEFGTV